MTTADHTQTYANDSATSSSTRTPLTQPRSRPVQGYVYFIGCGEHIKIGFSSRPLDRLRALQTSHPEALEILGTIRCQRSLEAKLHKKFADLRVRGEWFYADDDIWDYIDKHSIERKAELPKLRPEIRAAIGRLSRIRNAYGYDTPQGYRASNMMTILQAHEEETDEAAKARLRAALVAQQTSLVSLIHTTAN